VFAAIIQALISGFIIGGLARWAVPGPDPMPIWMTVVFGLLGSAVGSGIAVATFGSDPDSGTVFSALLFSVLAASLLVIAYRRFVQHRPITGPEAYRPPTRRPSKLGDVFGSPAKRAHERQEDVAEQLRKLNELKNEGLITDEEYESKKADLLARM
jgi:uncharacterized membrane protein YeaQ/YmgE (transglycosylase-associated protein family)